MTSGFPQVDSSLWVEEAPELSEVVSPLSDRLEALAGEIAAELYAAVDQLVDDWYEEMASLPELVSWRRPDLRAAIVPHARADITRELRALMNRRRLPARCPPELERSAQLAVEGSLPLWASLRAYRVGQAIQWQAWSDGVERRMLADADRRALLRAGSDFLFAYADVATRWVEQEYIRARDAPLRRREQRRVQLVARLLQGLEGDPAELEYELSGWHLGVVTSGERAEALLRQIGQQLGMAVLSLASGADSAWLWLGAAQQRPELERDLAELRLSAGTLVAWGRPGLGVAGFRRTHHEAQRAAAIGAALGRSLSPYADVALEDLAGADADNAWTFACRELGPLAGPDREARVLRETLLAYFGAAHRASSAAAVLGVHERTIGNRLRRAEQLLGCSVAERRVELEVSLRLHRLHAAARG